MKKLALSLLFICLLVTTGYFLFFNFTKKQISFSTTVSSPEDCIKRHFLNKSLWEKCFGLKLVNDSVFELGKDRIIIEKQLLNGFDINLISEKDTLNGFLGFTGTSNEKKALISFSSSKKVVEKKSLTHIASTLIKNLEDFFNDEEKVYGFKTAIERTKDFSLLVIKKSMDKKPTTEEVYSFINKIEDYIIKKNGVVSNSPMLNVYEDEPNKFFTMVALPTNSNVKGNGEIVFKQLVDGNLLTATIKGGPSTIENAEKQLKLYVTEYKKTSPAIPYQSLITNRLQEKDTAKWITKLNYPVFY